MGSRENFSIFISNIGGNYAVELQNGEIKEFFLESPNNFLGKFFASGGINYNYRFSPAAGTFPATGQCAASTRTFAALWRGSPGR